MLVTSKIKKLLTPELLRYTAAICDTKRIEKNKDKMFVLTNLLYTYDVPFGILGGATNRLVLLMDGYAVKFAMDDQGYRDNLIEFSLSPELQPYVTRSYETNGYMVVAEFVEVIKDLATFQMHKTEILKILDILGQDHLLGDVGFLVKNMTNWGIRDGHPVIVDYAYCHRFTENLFTCDRCGSSLIYDQTYDKLLCSDRSACKAVYTYNERKRIQGKKIDNDMIDERKTESIIMGSGELSKDIQTLDDMLVGNNKFIISNPYDEYVYNKMKEDHFMTVNKVGSADAFNALLELARDPNNAETRKVIYDGDDAAGVPEAIYTDEYMEQLTTEHELGFRPDATCDDGDEEPEEQIDYGSFDELIARVRALTGGVEKDTVDEEETSDTSMNGIETDAEEEFKEGPDESIADEDTVEKQEEPDDTSTTGEPTGMNPGDIPAPQPVGETSKKPTIAICYSSDYDKETVVITPSPIHSDVPIEPEIPDEKTAIEDSATERGMVKLIHQDPGSVKHAGGPEIYINNVLIVPGQTVEVM